MARSVGKHSIKPRRKLSRIVAVAASGVLIAAFGPAIGAHAATAVLPSTTTLSVAPASTTAGNAVTLTANVSVLGLPGLGIIPTGTVTFTSTDGAGGTATLGTKTLSCVLVPCTVSLTTSNVPVGTVSATATYSGQPLVLTGSSATTALSVTPNPNPGSSETVICYAGQPCDTGTLTSTDNTTKLDVHADPSANNQTVSGSLGSGTLHCHAGGQQDNDGDDDDGVFVGALATFSSTAPDATKTITYTGSGMTKGSTGYIMQHQYAEHTLYAGCYGSTNPFNGYTNGAYGPAPFVAADGLYEAMLSNCANYSGVRPCFTNVAASTYDSYVIKAPPGDPKTIG